MRRWLGLALGIVLVVGIVAAVVAALVVRVPAPRVAQIHGLPIMTVGQALAARPALHETDPIAVHGWYSDGVPHSCPAPSGPGGEMRQPSPLELYCRRGEIVLAERDESPIRVTRNGGSISVEGQQMSGPYLDPYFESLAIAQPIWQPRIEPWRPQPIIAIGHFGDHRAVDCLPEDIPFCLGVFVVDNVAVLRGAELGPVRLVDPLHGPPTRTLDDVEGFIERTYGPDAAPLTIASMERDEVSVYEDRADVMPGPGIVWLVRVVDRGPDGADPARLVVLVVDDVSLETVWSTEEGAR